MVDGVKGLREIDSHCHRPPGGARLVESCHHFMDEREQGGGSGPTRAETML